MPMNEERSIQESLRGRLGFVPEKEMPGLYSFAILSRLTRLRLVLGLSMFSLSAGCESTDPFTVHSSSPSKPAAQLEQSSPAAGNNILLMSAAVSNADSPGPTAAGTAVAPSSSAAEPGKIEERSSYNLTEALNRSLLTNPDLVTMRGQLSVNAAMVGVAETYPWNPFVQAEYFPQGTPFVANAPGMPASGAGYSNYYIWAMQRFELAHQIRYRIRSATAAMNQVEWNIFQAELLNVAQTARLYFSALYQKEINELAQETVQLNERLLGAVEKRFKANLARAADVTAARVAARQSRRQAELAENTYQASLLALRQQLNLPMTAPVDLTEKLADIKWQSVRSTDPSADETALAAQLVEGRPDVLAAQAGVRVSQANLSLARAARIPDLQAGTIYQTADDTTRYLGFRLQMDIPIFNNGGPLMRQRQAEMAQQSLTYEQLKVRAALEAQAAIDQFERVREIVAKVTPARGDAMPTELKEMTSLLEAGQADVIAVLTTQANLLQERRIYLDILNQLAQAGATVIQATGLPASRIVFMAACPQSGPTNQP